MPKHLLILVFLLISPLAEAWNGAGHRLSALIAWQQMSEKTQGAVSEALARHPDHSRWAEKAGTSEAAAIFAEASTWPDAIRNDPRFYDEGRQSATPAIPGLPDNARHKPWHYVDLDKNGQRTEGEIDHQIDRLTQLLRSTAKAEQISHALPWLMHLVGDIHQPLHVGHHDDEGGTKTEIENPLNRRQPFSTLHAYWDELPGPSSLRGKRLEKFAGRLLETYPAPSQGNTLLWRDESHRLLGSAYPPNGSLLPAITESFDEQSRHIANRRITEAGYRLGRLLERIFAARVSRETP